MNEITNKQKRLDPLTTEELNHPEVISFTEKIDLIALRKDLEKETEELNIKLMNISTMSFREKNSIVNRLIFIEKQLKKINLF